MRPRDGLARGLCALPARPRLASGRLLGRWPQRLPWRGAELGCSFRGGLPPFPRRARLRALPPSPRRAPPSGSHPSGNFSGGRGARSRAPRLRRGRLRAGRAPLHPRCLLGLPPGLWPCALRLPRRVRRPRPAARVAPVVWWSGASGEGGAILQREHRGTGTRLPALRSPPRAAIWPWPCKKAPALTKSGGLFVAHPVGAVWVTQSGAGDVVHIMPPTVGAHVVEFTSAPHATKIKFAIRWALVGQDHQADLVKARKAGRDGCPFVRRPLRFCHAPAPFRAVLIDHTQYTPAEGGGASTFCLSLPLKTVRLDFQPAA